MKLRSTWRVVATEADSRRLSLPIRPPGADTCELWYVDTRRTAVAALWIDGSLWLGGERAWAVGERVEALLIAKEGPSLPGGSGAIAGWYRVDPSVGTRYVVTAGAFGPPPGPPADLASLGLAHLRVCSRACSAGPHPRTARRSRSTWRRSLHRPVCWSGSPPCGRMGWT